MLTSALSLAISIPATTKLFRAIIQLPSLLGTGSRPMQLFGLRKTPDLSHAPRQALAAFEHERAQIQRRAAGQSRPFAHSGRFCRHKSTKETVKAIACGNAGCSGATVVTTLACYLHFAREAAGATGTRHSPRPLLGDISCIDSGASRRGIAEAYLNWGDVNDALLLRQFRLQRIKHFQRLARRHLVGM